jgi:hypothetical protein
MHLASCMPRSYCFFGQGVQRIVLPLQAPTSRRGTWEQNALCLSSSNPRRRRRARQALRQAPTWNACGRFGCCGGDS